MGLNSSGKSTFAVHLTKQAQKYGVPVIWIDVEGTASQENMLQLGADPNKIFLFQPKEGEQITVEKVTQKIKEIIEVFSGDTDTPVMVIWDSLAQTASDKEIEGSNTLANKASAVTEMATQIGQSINSADVAFVVVNQAREDFNANSFLGKQIKSPGGKAFEHWVSLRLEVKKASQIKNKVLNPITNREEDQYIGHIFRIITKKSKVSTPNKKSETFLISQPYKGIDYYENLYRDAVENIGTISKGAWRKYQPDDGDEISLRDADWVPFLESEKGKPIADELFLNRMKQLFPNGFVPLKNKHFKIQETEPNFAKLEEYYNSLDSEEESKDTETSDNKE